MAFRRKISPKDFRLKIVEFLNDARTNFINLTGRVCLISLDLAIKTNLGGRDSLIVGSYLHNNIPELYTHDEDLVGLGRVSMKGRAIRITDPIR